MLQYLAVGYFFGYVYFLYLPIIFGLPVVLLSQACVIVTMIRYTSTPPDGSKRTLAF